MDLSISSSEDTPFKSVNDSKSFFRSLEERDEVDGFHSPITTETDPSLQLSLQDRVLHQSDERKPKTVNRPNKIIMNHEENHGQGSLTETESDEYMADNHSIISDTSISIISSHHSSWQQKHSYDKLVSQYKKLKKENMSLKEALTQANYSDITILKTKLRGSQADVIRFRQMNNELKERIQALEEKMLLLLSQEKEEEIDRQGEDKGKEISVSQKLKKQFQERRKQSTESPATVTVGTSYNPANPIDVSDNAGNTVIQNLQAKCRHYEKLLRVYEKNMSVMQNEVDRLKRKDPNSPKENGKQENIFEDKRSALQPSNVPDQSNGLLGSHPSQALSKSVEFQLDQNYRDHLENGENSLTITGSMSKKRFNQLSKDMKLLIEDFRANDEKTIKELAAEVKRLTKLLPRKKVEELDTNTEEDVNSVTSEVPSSSGSVSSYPIVMPEIKDSQEEKSGTNVEIEEINQSKALSTELQYGFWHLICSFTAGSVLMLFWLWRYLPT